ncbi:hypothetical protein MG290_01645 [Flavobacterium sp. CBA20B-1]|uniref:hypothetical protein n=1 Tax=unclassified Flavobacterium TaxID=196869 RepID=UPI002224694E|nr:MULTISPECIES: hypothetical protein [unclassified Flavobacterium]WCM42399.1 hypothetical protein MG290_01645 [Flavobacterium sp. CBA20B-1]
MYSESSKILISKRVGWDNPAGSLIPISINEENQIATSGRRVNSFHQLANAINLFHTVDESYLSENYFNELLNDIRLQGAIEVMNKILDQHHCYDFEFDYDKRIEKYQSLFDEPLGYALAIKCIETFLSSNRSNYIERNTKLGFEMLKIELEGVKNEQGFTISQGLNAKFYSSIRKAQKIFFPEPIQIIGGAEW